jgi:hypothetical protein
MKIIYCSITNGGNDQFAQSKEGRSRTPQRANMEKMTPQERTETIEKMTKELNLDVKTTRKAETTFTEQKQQELPKADEKRKRTSQGENG